MSEDPYRQLAAGVRCDCCGGRVTGERRAYFRFDAAGTRHWCCGATACLQQFFGHAEPIFEVVDRQITPADEP